MTPQPTTESRLQELAGQVLDSAVEEGSGAEREYRWGQFLDVSKSYDQTGPYGTAAAVLILAMAGRLSSPGAASAVRWLSRLWSGPDLEAKHSVQTIRLAVTLLALRAAHQWDDTVPEVSQLTEKLLSWSRDGLWGNWFANEGYRDDSPRALPSALSLMAIAFNRRPECALPPQVETAAVALAVFARKDHTITPLESSACLAALACVNSPKIGKSELLDLWRASTLTIRDAHLEPSVYFMDFEYFQGTRRVFARDYFIAFPSILAALAGCQPVAWWRLRAFRDAVVRRLDAALTNGRFRSVAADREATLDQAWIALLLSSAVQPSTSLLGRIYECLYRDRRNPLPLAARAWAKLLLLATVAGLLTLVSAGSSPSLPQLVVLNAGSLVLAALFGEPLRELLAARPSR